MLSIFKREFKSFFQNVIGWIFIAGMIFMAALYFCAYNLSYGVSEIYVVLIRLLMIFVFSVPVLSMRILTEEKKQKIDQLILTSPVSVGKIVVGKYLSMIAILLITTAAIGSFTLTLLKYTTPDWRTNLIALLGFALYGAVTIAICMFISSFTESQVIAAIINIIVLFVIYLMSGITYILDQTQNSVLMLIAKALGIFDFAAKFELFLSGILDIGAIIYFLSFIVVFLFLTTQSVQKRRYSTSVKNLSLSAFSMTSIVLVIVISVIANLVVSEFPTKYTQFDMTASRLYTLSDATKGVIADISEPITIYVYSGESDKDAIVDKILEQYTELSSNIKVEYKDPAKSPKFYEKYTTESPTYNSLFMENSSRTRYVNYENMYITDYVANDSGSYDTKTSYDIEGQITSAINYMNTGLAAKICCVTGHDEMALDSGYTDIINKQNYVVEDITLLTDDIPEECELLVIHAPLTDFSEGDAAKVLEYAKNGGSVLIDLYVADKVKEEMPNLNSILEFYAIHVADGLVVDTESSSQYPFYIIPSVENTDITEGVYGKKPVWMPFAKALLVNTDDEKVSVDSFLFSSTSSYKKGNVEEIDDYTYSDEDEMGPFTVAAHSTTTTESGSTSEGYIIGSPYMFTDQADALTANANATIFMNIVNASVDNTNTSVVVPSKSMDSEQFMVPGVAARIIFVVLIFLVPIALLAIGFVIWSKRRKK